MGDTEQALEFATENLAWVQSIELMAKRRLTEHEVLCLRDVVTLNGLR